MDIQKYPKEMGNDTPNEGVNYKHKYKDINEFKVAMRILITSLVSYQTNTDKKIPLLDKAWNIYDILNKDNINTMDILIKFKELVDLSYSVDILTDIISDYYTNLLELYAFGNFNKAAHITRDNISINNMEYISNILKCVNIININLGMSKNILDVLFNMNLCRKIDVSIIQNIVKSDNTFNNNKILDIIDKYNDAVNSFYNV